MRQATLRVMLYNLLKSGFVTWISVKKKEAVIPSIGRPFLAQHLFFCSKLLSLGFQMLGWAAAIQQIEGR